MGHIPARGRESPEFSHRSPQVFPSPWSRNLRFHGLRGLFQPKRFQDLHHSAAAQPRRWPCPHLEEHPGDPCAASLSSGERGWAGGSSGRAWESLREAGTRWQAAARVKCAVCPGATRCPCGKGLGAARGRERQRRESRESRDLRELREWSRGHLCLSAPTPGLALPQPHWPREALLDAGKAPGSRREGAWNAAAPGCS